MKVLTAYDAKKLAKEIDADAVVIIAAGDMRVSMCYTGISKKFAHAVEKFVDDYLKDNQGETSHET